MQKNILTFTLAMTFGLLPWISAVDAQAQGSLTPTGAPGPTFKTLQQVEPRTPIDSVNTPGDANSIYKITQPGSYYLTGNISYGVRVSLGAKENGIEVSASNVTIDLNGFRLSGGGSTNSLSGIVMSSSFKNLTVKNGMVTDWGLDGISAAGVHGSHFENLVLDGNGNTGLATGNQSSITRCAAINNSTNGIVTGTFSTVTESQARANPKVGISVGSRSVVSHCTSGDASAGDCIVAEAYSVITHCTAYNAFNWGIRAVNRPVISFCTVDSCGHNDVNNITGGILLRYAGQVRNCTITANIIGIEVFSTTDGGGALIADNQIDSNTGGGIDLLSGANRVEGNTFCCNGGPAIRTHDRGNLLVRNHASGNNGGSADYVLGGKDIVGPVVTGQGSTTGLANGGSPWANFQQ